MVLPSSSTAWHAPEADAGAVVVTVVRVVVTVGSGSLAQAPSAAANAVTRMIPCIFCIVASFVGARGRQRLRAGWCRQESTASALYGSMAEQIGRADRFSRKNDDRSG